MSKLKRSAITQRHNMALQRLSGLLQKGGGSVLIEPNWYDGKRPDAQESILLDVSIVHPAAPSYFKSAAGSSLAASKIREKQKIAKYQALAKEEEARFVPFVMETYGSMGSYAAGFLKEVGSGAPEQLFMGEGLKSYAVRALSIGLQAGNAFVLQSGCLQAREWSRWRKVRHSGTDSWCGDDRRNVVDVDLTTQSLLASIVVPTPIIITTNTTTTTTNTTNTTYY